MNLTLNPEHLNGERLPMEEDNDKITTDDFDVFVPCRTGVFG